MKLGSSSSLCAASRRDAEAEDMTQVDARDQMIINAPKAQVWEAIKDPAVHTRWHPFTTKIEVFTNVAQRVSVTS